MEVSVHCHLVELSVHCPLFELEILKITAHLYAALGVDTPVLIAGVAILDLLLLLSATFASLNLLSMFFGFVRKTVCMNL